MTPKDPFLEGTFWDKFWRPIRSRALLFTPDFRSETVLSKQYSARFLFTHKHVPWRFPHPVSGEIFTAARLQALQRR